MGLVITARDFGIPLTDAQNLQNGASFYDPMTGKDYLVAVNLGGSNDVEAFDLRDAGPLVMFNYQYQVLRTAMIAQVSPFVE